jgi:hypothetical protein
LDDIFQQVATKWKNTLLFLMYGEDFTHPPPLEVDVAALSPKRTPEQDASRFHPKYGFQAMVGAEGSSLSLPSLSPSRKARRKEQRQLKQLKEQLSMEEERKKQQLGSPRADMDPASGSVWDPTWGVISREVQDSWRAEEERREAQRRGAVERSRGGSVRPVRQATPVAVTASPEGLE